ncbi:MAG: Lrp/AsnC family transcriptional regulator [Desulfurococcales archaeon]|nr:Lrp/AsnC family transcriptional regulator [Desulfurococcales archaeon]
MQGGPDDRDIEILEYLESDARIPWRRLASILGVSEATIYIRVKKLSSLGILRGFRALIDPSPLGLSTVLFVFLKVKPGMLGRVREKLGELDFVVEIHEVAGDYQLLAKVLAPSQGEAARAVEEIAGIEGVTDYATIASLQTVKIDSSIVRAYKYWARVGQRESPATSRR